MDLFNKRIWFHYIKESAFHHQGIWIILLDMFLLVIGVVTLQYLILPILVFPLLWFYSIEHFIISWDSHSIQSIQKLIGEDLNNTIFCFEFFLILYFCFCLLRLEERWNWFFHIVWKDLIFDLIGMIDALDFFDEIDCYFLKFF